MILIVQEIFLIFLHSYQIVTSIGIWYAREIPKSFHYINTWQTLIDRLMASLYEFLFNLPIIIFKGQFSAWKKEGILF